MTGRRDQVFREFIDGGRSRIGMQTPSGTYVEACTWITGYAVGRATSASGSGGRPSACFVSIRFRPAMRFSLPRR